MLKVVYEQIFSASKRVASYLPPVIVSVHVNINTAGLIPPNMARLVDEIWRLRRVMSGMSGTNEIWAEMAQLYVVDERLRSL